jgi:hypothetical protein
LVLVSALAQAAQLNGLVGDNAPQGLVLRAIAPIRLRLDLTQLVRARSLHGRHELSVTEIKHLFGRRPLRLAVVRRAGER